MHDATGYGVALVLPEGDRLAALDVDEELPVEHEEELVFVVVLVPVEFPLDDAEPNDSVVVFGSTCHSDEPRPELASE
jgi:hypothetical protein